jgi:hypothetical protein
LRKISKAAALPEVCHPPLISNDCTRFWPRHKGCPVALVRLTKTPTQLSMGVRKQSLLILRSILCPHPAVVLKSAAAALAMKKS